MNKIDKALIIFTTIFVVALNGIWFIPTISGLSSSEPFLNEFFGSMFSFFPIILLFSIPMIITPFLISLAIIIYKICKSHYDLEFIRLMQKITLIVKLGTVPFFIANFIFFALLMFGMMNPLLIFFSPIVPITGVTFTMIPLLTTSVFSIITFVLAKTNNLLSQKAIAILVFAQFIYVIDIISAIIGVILVKRNMKKPDALVIDVIE